MKHFFLFCLAMILIMGGCLFAYVTYWYFGDDMMSPQMLDCLNIGKWITLTGAAILAIVVFSQNLKSLKWKS